MHFLRHASLGPGTLVKADRWTQEEVDYLDKHYPTHGGVTCARFLGRSVRAVYRKAWERGLLYGIVTNKMLISEVARESGMNRNTVLKAAHREGVVKLYGSRTKPIGVVPVAWADKFIRERRAGREEGLEEAYVPIHEVTRVFNVHASTIRAWMRGEPTGGHLFKKVRRRLISCRDGIRWGFNPSDVLLAHREWRKERGDVKRPGPKPRKSGSNR